MASDGGSGPEGTEKRPIRRPAIRRRVITAPRAATSARPLPPPRLPVARKPARPRLVLVVDDEVQAGPAPSIAHRSAPRWAIAAIAGALALALGTTAVWFASRAGGSQRLSTRTQEPVSMTTVNAGPVAMLARPPRAQSTPDVPVVDVNSLPAAPQRGPARSRR
jgi:hypothetical protein